MSAADTSDYLQKEFLEQIDKATKIYAEKKRKKKNKKDD
jgi:hypothetical protein